MIRRYRVAVAAVLAVGAGMATMGATRAPDADDEAIRATIQHYFDQGMEVRKAFWPDAEMLYIRDGSLNVVPIEDYIARAESRADEPPRTDVEKRIVSIDRTGTAAVAKLELKGPDWMLYDYMSMLKIDGEWKIVNKIFSRPEG